MAKKIKIDIEEFLNALGYLYQLRTKSITDLDFTCVFVKDLTLAQKKKLKRQFEDDIVKLLKCAFAFKGFNREFKIPPFRKDIKITHNFKKGTWGARVIKPKPKK